MPGCQVPGARVLLLGANALGLWDAGVVPGCMGARVPGCRGAGMPGARVLWLKADALDARGWIWGPRVLLLRANALMEWD